MRLRFPGVLFVALCGLAPAVLGNLLSWSAWLWGFMSMGAASGSLLLVLAFHGSGNPQADPYGNGEPEPPEAPPEEPYQETRVIDAPLPSAVDGYDFLFSATIWWRSAPDDSGRSDGASPALAVSAVVSRALEVVRHEQPGRASFARYLLEGELSVPLPDRSGRVTALAADATLTLASADRERLRKLSDLRKDEEIWEYEREHERNKRRYLGDDVLQSAGSAVVWWLARHEDEIEKAVDMIGPLAQIAAAANDEEVPELFRHLLVPPAAARSEATGGSPLWGDPGPGAGPFDREAELGAADRLVLLLAAVGVKPDMDEYTVLVNRVVMSLEMAELYEAADEIRRDLLPTPDRADAPDTDTGEGDTTSRYFWDDSHQPQRPTAPRTQDDEEEDENES
ncbi:MULTISPECIES: hypothetical protein [unclassified Streptomyces]|uniref:hypothetical protein n=1 Tax=unclassified Streptomyces TaxID=2593676 RepID=UPI0006F315B4|nr:MULTISPECIES: hypothetical protein [unclassified Streptomyces]KQX58847.1 hypothetical protein ASD33_00600 [Streptomyces sp. Root1304]KRB00108.1 hypothetical protein ASE09_00600 [Streptomyces sp. Root66D1]